MLSVIKYTNKTDHYEVNPVNTQNNATEVPAVLLFFFSIMPDRNAR